jgi:hypothetical protein
MIAAKRRTEDSYVFQLGILEAARYCGSSQ